MKIIAGSGNANKTPANKNNKSFYGGTKSILNETIYENKKDE